MVRDTMDIWAVVILLEIPFQFSMMVCLPTCRMLNEAYACNKTIFICELSSQKVKWSAAGVKRSLFFQSRINAFSEIFSQIVSITATGYGMNSGHVKWYGGQLRKRKVLKRHWCCCCEILIVQYILLEIVTRTKGFRMKVMENRKILVEAEGGCFKHRPTAEKNIPATLIMSYVHWRQ